MSIKRGVSGKERREALENTFGVTLPHIGSGIITDEDASRNCENFIGATQIPLGVAGPLHIKGVFAKGEFFVPLATTEAALVASVNRGAKAITQAGGTVVFAHRVGTTRGPVFSTGKLQKSMLLASWVKKHKMQLQKVAKQTSSHIELIDIKIKTLPQYVFIRFSFHTEDAMGMNIVTYATDAITKVIEKEIKVKCLSLAGNFDIDKKPAWLNMIDGRGIEVHAEVVLPKKTLQDVLKTTARSMYDVWLGKCMLGSAVSGSLGFNAHFANIVAAVFLATGQDAAHVVEGSLGITTMRIEKNNLYCSVSLPALLVGTVGGGTHLKTQKEAFSILGISGQGDVVKFAEIIAAAVLAGEISLLASLSEGTLSRAHKTLGRRN